MQSKKFQFQCADLGDESLEQICGSARRRARDNSTAIPVGSLKQIFGEPSQCTSTSLRNEYAAALEAAAASERSSQKELGALNKLRKACAAQRGLERNIAIATEPGWLREGRETLNLLSDAPQHSALNERQDTLEKTIKTLQNDLAELKADGRAQGCDNKPVKLDKLIDLIRNFEDSSSRRLYLDSQVCGPAKVIDHVSMMDANTYRACCKAVKDDRLGAHTRLVAIISQIFQDNPMIEQQAVQWASKEAVPVLQALQRKLEPLLRRVNARKELKYEQLVLQGKPRADILRIVEKQYSKEADKLVRDWNRISGRISGGGRSTLSKLAAVTSIVLAIVLAVLVVNLARGATLPSEFTIQTVKSRAVGYYDGLVRILPGRPKYPDADWYVTQEDVYGLASFASILNYLASSAYQPLF